MVSRRLFPGLILGLFASLALHAQAPTAPPATSWQTATELNGVDFSGLTAAQKASALKMLRDSGCTCGCDMKVAQCRVVDPQCAYSKGIAEMIVKGLKAGKKPEEVTKIVSESAIGKPREPQKILEDPIKIVTTGDPSTGPATARVVLVEFSDFECPYCAKATGELHRILAAYPQDVRLIYKQFPLPMHPHARMAALASLAAFEQGKFWELHDKMFANFRQLSNENILAWAQQLGLDTDKFKTAMDSARNKGLVERDLQMGEMAGVTGTPSLFMDGKRFNGPIAMDALKPYLDEELKAAHTASRK